MRDDLDSGKGLIRQANEARILGAGEKVFARAGFNVSNQRHVRFGLARRRQDLPAMLRRCSEQHLVIVAGRDDLCETLCAVL